VIVGGEVFFGAALLGGRSGAGEDAEADHERERGAHTKDRSEEGPAFLDGTRHLHSFVRVVTDL